ncbi:MAG: segregation/condensation protein A [Armatimonadetes bacterium]|nr:segregation/condensation protein A [Armatimonadota bacterium]
MKLPKVRKDGYQIVLPIFEGPLDLLLHLIRENRLDIYDIPIAEVTEQYLHYLSLMESPDLEIAGEFLVMAATLLEIKSRMLLPPDTTADEEEDEADPRAELVERLIEYQRYKEAAGLFREYETERMKVFKSGVRDFEIDYAPFLLENVTPQDLLEALRRALAEVGEGEEEVTTLARRTITVRMRMSELWRKVAASEQGVLFDDLFEDARQRAEIVITFLAILELLRLRRIIVRQAETFGRIEIYRYEEQDRKVSDG